MVSDIGKTGSLFILSGDVIFGPFLFDHAQIGEGVRTLHHFVQLILLVPHFLTLDLLYSLCLLVIYFLESSCELFIAQLLPCNDILH